MLISTVDTMCLCNILLCVELRGYSDENLPVFILSLATFETITKKLLG